MNKYARVWTVYRKELIETLRDRRTLMAMVVVPVVLYPVLMFVLVQALSSEKGRQEERKYTVAVPDAEHRAWLTQVLAHVDAERQQEQAAFERAAEAAGTDPTAMGADALRTQLGSEQIDVVIADEPGQLWEQVAAGMYHAAVIARDVAREGGDENRIVQILYSDTNPLSEVVYRQLNRILASESERIVYHRVTKLAGTQDILTPIVTTNLSTTSPDKQFTKVLALIVPFLLVTMTVTGAMYPAIDLTAGERERGTLETLAVSPVPVGQIVAGKFGVIVTIAMATTALNLASMTAVIHFSGIGNLFGSARQMAAAEEITASEELRSAPAEPGSPAALQRINVDRRRALEADSDNRIGFVTTAAPIVLLAMIPFAVLFGGVMLAVCSFARTFKEAQNYMMPVMMSAIVPAMVVSYMPTIELRGALVATPVANVVILMRELFLGNFEIGTAAIVLLSTSLYAAAAVAVATRIYGNEAVLFSDVGSYKTLLLRRFIRPQRVPTAAFALLTVALLFPINFFIQSSIIKRGATWESFCIAIAVTQIGLFGAAVVLLAWYAKLNLRETFSLRMPSLAHAIGTLLVVVSVVPVVELIQTVYFKLVPPSANTIRMLESQEMMIAGIPLWAIVLVMAALPGICEELTFRGLLLTGLRDRIGWVRTALVVGLVFGLFHIYIFKIPVIALMGTLLAFVCLRTGSIFPAMLIHVANNGIGAAASRMASAGQPWLRDFLGLQTEYKPNLPITINWLTAVYIAIFLAGVILIAAIPSRVQSRRGFEVSPIGA